MIKVALIEDDAFVKDELVSLINHSQYLECVMSASSAENFFKYFKSSDNIDILLSDIRLPGISGIQAILKIKQARPDIHAIVLSSFHDNDTIFKALRAGATGYILKDNTLEEIEQQLIDVMNGKPPLSPAIARRMISFFNTNAKKKRSDLEKLTTREQEVIKLLIEGESYKGIAGLLDLSINGVRYHVKNIYKKLHVNARYQIMKMHLDGELASIIK